MSAFDRLIEQIDAFIRKYYKNEMIKGLLLSLGFLLFTILLVSSLEYFGRFNQYVRAFLLFSFIGVNSYILIKYLFVPIAKLLEFGKRINRFQAASIIGNFFPQVSDRLLNTLQLQDENQEANYELLRASVMQRSKSLAVFNFTDAVDISQNKRYLKYILPLFFLFLSIAIFIPGLLTQGTERVVRFDKNFVPPSPFEFKVLNKNLFSEEGQSFEILAELVGQKFPNKVYLVANGGRYLMNWTSKNGLSFTFPKLSESVNFHLEGGTFKSKDFVLKVMPKSVLGRLSADLIYPAYLGKKNETIDNATDLIVPEGTEVRFSCLAKNTSKVVLKGGKESKVFENEGFEFGGKMKNSQYWFLFMTNAVSNKVDSVGINLQVIKDDYPSILVNELKDSVRNNVRYFQGQLADDYGLSNLQFVYKITGANGKSREERVKVKQPRGISDRFDYGVDFGRENIQLDDKIEYWFVVTDNDGVNGGKSARSESFVYRLPNLEKLNDQRDEDQKEINKELNNVLQKAQELKKDVNRLQKEMNDAKSTSWKNKSEMQRLAEEQKSLQEKLQSIQEKMEESVQDKNQLSEMDPELLKKQEMIEDLLKELMDDEMLELLEKLQELMEKGANKQEKLGLMDELKQNAEDQKKSLDRSLEMLKKLQVNEKIDDVEKELEKLAEEQLKLKEQLEKQDKVDDALQKKQDELNKKFEDVLKEMDTIQKLNNELERPMELDDQKELKEQIQEEMKNASDNLEKDKKSKAKEEQKKAADDMKKLAEELNKMQQESNQQQASEDIESLKRVLKSLMALSFDQESNMKSFERVDGTDPKYRVLGRNQRNIVDRTVIVRDSLEALSRRQPKIASFIDKELNEISTNHKSALEHIDEIRRRELNSNQQLVMTSYNNLALLLNEALESMQQDMQNAKEGDGSCDKPGSKGRPKPGQGKPGSMDMKQMLKQQLEQMQKGMQPGGSKPGDQKGQGNQPGGTNPGNQGMGMPGLMNKEIAKMVGEQTMIRQRLEQLRNELNKDGQGKGNQLNPLIKELEQQERDLVNKRFSRDMINRQKEILTRLLESEKAMMERGFDEKRESKEGKDKGFGNKIVFDEYNKEKLRQVELLRTIDPVFKKYYKDKANGYFNSTL